MESSLLVPLLFRPLVFLLGLNRPDPGDQSDNQNDSGGNDNQKGVVLKTVVDRHHAEKQNKVSNQYPAVAHEKKNSPLWECL